MRVRSKYGPGRRAVAALVVMLAGGVSILPAQDQRIRAVLEWQDQRRPVDSVIIGFLQDSDPSVRRAAIVAMANVQDTISAGQFALLLSDSSARVRGAAAFGLGQIPCWQSAQVLARAVQTEEDPEIRSLLAEALGKTGQEANLQELLTELEQKAVALSDEDVVTAVMRFAIRGIRSEASVWKCFDLLHHPSSDVRWKALYALWRSAPYQLVDLEITKRADSLQELAADGDPNVRMNLATLLGRSSAPAAATILHAMVLREAQKPDWRVQVQLMRALGAQATARHWLLNDLAAGVASTNEHVRIAALQALTALPPATVRDTAHYGALRDAVVNCVRTGSTEIEAVQGEAHVAIGKHFESEFVSAATLLELQNISPRLKAKLLEAVAQQPSRRNLVIMLQYLDHDSVRVAMAAWDFLRRVAIPPVVRVLSQDTVFWREIPPTIAEKAARVLARHDAGITTVVSSVFTDTLLWRRMVLAHEDGKLRDALVNAFIRLTSDSDAEAMHAVLETLAQIGDAGCVPAVEKALGDPNRAVALQAANTLKHLTGRDYAARVPAYAPPRYALYDWETLSWISAHPRVVMKTSKGDVVLRLLPEDAPWTVVNFVALARKGFYNGLLFHRVVPNFVVQGGDPRGDGWGGPGYTIRTEISMDRYDRGTCGMASAGKDTEGCQFFVTHSPAPHLDGRYTIFAKVVAGMETVDRLQIGDRILSVGFEAR